VLPFAGVPLLLLHDVSGVVGSVLGFIAGRAVRDWLLLFVFLLMDLLLSFLSFFLLEAVFCRVSCCLFGALPFLFIACFCSFGLWGWLVVACQSGLSLLCIVCAVACQCIWLFGCIAVSSVLR